MFIKLIELGYEPFIIGTHWKNKNISFLNKTTNLIVVKNFSEIKRSDYDFLIVNSDQTWRKFDEFFYDYGFLKFAANWNITKFVYGASLGLNYWALTKKDEKIIKGLLKTFKSFSIREKGSINLIKNHLGIKPMLVLDPTLLIDKRYYLKLIKNYKSAINSRIKYIFNYSIRKEENLISFLNIVQKKLGYKIYNYFLNNSSTIYDFIYGIVNSHAVITNSYHGTLFSIIFNKPFISFISKNIAKERFYSIRDIFGLHDRIIDKNIIPKLSLLNMPLKINKTLLNQLKIKSINFIKKNLNI